MDDDALLDEELLLDESRPLAGKRVALVGKLGGMNRREAQQIIRDHGGTPVERVSETSSTWW